MQSSRTLNPNLSTEAGQLQVRNSDLAVRVPTGNLPEYQLKLHTGNRAPTETDRWPTTAVPPLG